MTAALARATSASLLGEVLVIWLVFSPRAWRTGSTTDGRANPTVNSMKLSSTTGFWSPARRRLENMVCGLVVKEAARAQHRVQSRYDIEPWPSKVREHKLLLL